MELFRKSFKNIQAEQNWAQSVKQRDRVYFNYISQQYNVWRHEMKTQLCLGYTCTLHVHTPTHTKASYYTKRQMAATLSDGHGAFKFGELFTMASGSTLWFAIRVLTIIIPITWLGFEFWVINS